MSNERNWLESTCDYSQVVQQTKEEKYKMYDEHCSNEELINMIQEQDRIISERLKEYKSHDIENIKTYERKSLIEMVINGGLLLDIVVHTTYNLCIDRNEK